MGLHLSASCTHRHPCLCGLCRQGMPQSPPQNQTRNRDGHTTPHTPKTTAKTARFAPKSTKVGDDMSGEKHANRAVFARLAALLLARRFFGHHCLECSRFSAAGDLCGCLRFRYTTPISRGDFLRPGKGGLFTCYEFKDRGGTVQ